MPNPVVDDQGAGSETAADFLADFDTSKPLTFFIGWLSGKSYHLRRVELHEEVADEFRQVASDQLIGTENSRGVVYREAEAWTADAQLAPETYLECSLAEVGASPRLTNRPKDERLLPVLQSAENLPVINAREIQPKTLSLYGFTIGDPGGRAVFIRRANPRRGLGSGKFFGRFSDVLRRVDDPVFAFDGLIDLIVAGDRLVILSQTAFSMLFRDQTELKALVPKWAASLGTHYPFEDEALSRIIERAARDSRQRQRLESIVARGHLQGVTREQLDVAMTECGLDSSSYFTHSGKLTASDDDVPALLYFLNEDLYSGVISGDPFRSDRKAKR